MTLQQLRTFLAVCDEMSITSAASKLFITQSAVSQQIKALEEEFEVKFFQKRGRRLYITADGKVFYHIAKEIMEKADSIIDKLKGHEKLRGRKPQTGKHPSLGPVSAHEAAYGVP